MQTLYRHFVPVTSIPNMISQCQYSQNKYINGKNLCIKELFLELKPLYFVCFNLNTQAVFLITKLSAKTNYCFQYIKITQFLWGYNQNIATQINSVYYSHWGVGAADWTVVQNQSSYLGLSLLSMLPIYEGKMQVESYLMVPGLYATLNWQSN